VDVLVARQAIFDRQRKVYGYELLYRSDALNNAFDGTEAEAATMQVLSNALMSIGADKLLDGKKAFVNFDHRLLLANMHKTLPRESLVIEILETVVPTQDLITLCQNIQQEGYSLALDDFIDGPEFAPLTGIAGLIKVDMRLSSVEEQERLLRTYKPRGVVMLAEKVETYTEFQWAQRAGYDLFQGYFFARPEVLRSQHIPAVKAACLRVLREVQQADLDFQRLGRLIQEDVSLSYQLLRCANSAMFQRSAKIESITRALLTLGEDRIRSWVALATLPMLATNKPGELVKLSLVRARFCELLAGVAHNGRTNDAFLMGMFSLLDALIDQPLDEALRSVDLGKEVAGALLGIAPDEDFLTCLYRLNCCYEQGNWSEVERLSEKCGIPPAAIGQAYLEATEWAENVIQSVTG
jgi:EAL and modified HD-GYP domain-containing signal transduction protein